MHVLFNKSFCLRNADLLKVGVWLKNTNFENVILKKKKRVECYSKLMLLYIFAFQNHISPTKGKILFFALRIEQVTKVSKL